MLEALNHTLRRRILRAFGDRDEQVSSAHLARILGAPISEVAYHVAFLVRSGAVEVGGTEHARGASKRLYRLTAEGKAEWVRGVLDASRDSDDR